MKPCDFTRIQTFTWFPVYMGYGVKAPQKSTNVVSHSVSRRKLTPKLFFNVKFQIRFVSEGKKETFIRSFFLKVPCTHITKYSLQ